MSHRDLMSSGFTSPVKQRNIVSFVGNGFDLQAMYNYGAKTNTRYESFFHFLKLRSFNTENLIYREMERLKQDGKEEQGGKEDWSDVEAIVEGLFRRDRSATARLVVDLREMQQFFAEFLDFAVPSALLIQLGEHSMNEKLALASLQGFLKDLSDDSYRQLTFPTRCDNFDAYNFVFFNFNYTSIFDNYIYLDQQQFDPMPNRTVDRNFSFEGNPGQVSKARIRPGDVFSSYVMTEIVHPHGAQGIPRSLLFGIDTPEAVAGNRDQALRLAKPFWAQNQIRYGHLFNDTELFIIFGCSLGESDRWWWSKIAESLSHAMSYAGSDDSFQAELIIY